MVSEFISGMRSRDMHPLQSVGTFMTLSIPKPSNANALKILEWASTLTTTLIGGAPNNPRRSTSQSLAFRIADRAAAKAVKLAIVTPETNPTDAPRATGRISVSHLSHTDSMTALTGLVTNSPAFWSHAVDSQFAANAGTWDPPMTNPKYRPPVLAIVAGDPYRFRKSIV